MSLHICICIDRNVLESMYTYSYSQDHLQLANMSLAYIGRQCGYGHTVCDKGSKYDRP